MRKTVFLSVAANLDMCPRNDLPEVVLAGRSNVGKSSFINALGDNRTLAKVSSMPGKTKLVVYFLADGRMLFADLPGYGYAKAAKEDKSKYQGLVDDYLTSGRKFALVIHFIDIRHQPSAEDRLMKDWLESQGLPYFIVLTKADKLSKLQMNQRAAQIRSEMNVPENIPVLPLGNKEGIDPIKAAIERLHRWPASSDKVGNRP